MTDVEWVIVPDALRSAIYAAIDKQLEQCPEVAPHREEIYRDLLAYYNEHGVIPDFELSTSERKDS